MKRHDIHEASEHVVVPLVGPEQSSSKLTRHSSLITLLEVLKETDDADTLTLEADPEELELEDNPDELTLEQTWKSCLGYYLLLKTKPDDLDAFAAAVSVSIAFKAQQHTGFLWLTYEESSLSEIDCIETKPDEADPSKVVLVQEVLLDFGGYKIPFANAAPVVYENPDDPSGFVFLVPAESSESLPERRDGANVVRWCSPDIPG